MAKDHVKLEIVNENNKDSDKHLDSEIERIFGTPTVPKVTPNNVLLDSERNHYANGKHHPTDNDSAHSSQPLLEPDREKPRPPLAGPEIDDLDGDPPKDATPYPGIDDGLLEPSDKKPSSTHNDGSEHEASEPETVDEHHVHTRTHSFNDGKVPWEHDEPDYPYDHAGAPGFGLDDRGISPVPGIIPDVNTYQQKKNLAQGMMDLALLSANANQLRYVLESSTSHPYYYSSVTFISLSILFQVLVGVGLIMNSRYDVNNHKEICKADKINNMTVLGIFLITIVNVFITSFSVATPTTGFPQVPQHNIMQANAT